MEGRGLFERQLSHSYSSTAPEKIVVQKGNTRRNLNSDIKISDGDKSNLVYPTGRDAAALYEPLANPRHAVDYRMPCLFRLRPA